MSATRYRIYADNADLAIVRECRDEDDARSIGAIWFGCPRDYLIVRYLATVSAGLAGNGAGLERKRVTRQSKAMVTT